MRVSTVVVSLTWALLPSIIFFFPFLLLFCLLFCCCFVVVLCFFFFFWFLPALFISVTVVSSIWELLLVDWVATRGAAGGAPAQATEYCSHQSPIVLISHAH